MSLTHFIVLTCVYAKPTCALCFIQHVVTLELIVSAHFNFALTLLWCRHQWFQTQTHVEVAVLAKKMTKDRVDIKIEDQHLTVVIRSAEGEQEFELKLPLYSKVSSSYYKGYYKGYPNQGILQGVLQGYFKGYPLMWLVACSCLWVCCIRACPSNIIVNIVSQSYTMLCITQYCVQRLHVLHS